MTPSTMQADLSQVELPESPQLPPPAKPHPRPRWRPSLLLLVASGLIVAAVGTYLALSSGREAYEGPTWTVRKQKLQYSIVERGTLESAEASDILCRVKARSQGSTISSTIKWVIENGTQVYRGQKLVEFDDSGLQDQLKSQNNTVNKSKSEWVQAEENFLIVESQNFSDVKSAEVAKTLAVLDVQKYVGDAVANRLLGIDSRDQLRQYLEGQFERDLRAELKTDPTKTNSEFLQTLNEIEGRIEVARSDREMNLDRSSWSARMVKKGYLSRSQAEADRSRLESSEINLRKIQGELDILKKFTLERTVTDLWSKVMEADRALQRVETQAKSKRVQADADRESKKAIYLQEESRRNEIEEEIRKCVIYSPQDGLVVYYIPEQSRYGSGSQQSTVAQGEPVREGQKLMSIPNLSRMLVNVRVHEAMVSKVKGERTQPTGFSESLQAAVGFGQNATEILPLFMAFPELRTQFKDLDEEVTFPGQYAEIRVEAYPTNRYEGHVKTVATVASQNDFLSTDVKVYQTMVAMDGTADNLKPGMSAAVSIRADESISEVLVVPLQAVVGNLAMGSKRKVYVLENQKPVERMIDVGMSNDQLIEVRDGLREGEVVVVNPKGLFSEKGNMKVGGSTSRRGVDSDEGAGKGRKSDGKSQGRKPREGEMPGGAPGLPPGGPSPGGPDPGAPRADGPGANGGRGSSRSGGPVLRP